MRGFHERELPRLLDLLYDAALDPERWQVFLDALPGPFGGARGVLHSYDVSTRTITGFHIFGGDDSFIASYERHFRSVNPYPASGFERIPIGELVSATSVLAASVVEKTEFFNDWMMPQGITSDHLAVSVCRDKSSVALLSIAPHAAVYRNDRKTYESRFAQLVPHLTRAVEINRVMATSHRAERALGTSLDALRPAAFVVDEVGRLLLANKKGEDLLRCESVLRADRSKQLRANQCADNAPFQAAIMHALRPVSTLVTLPIRLTSCTSGRRFIAWAVPCGRGKGTNLRSQYLLDTRAEAAALVLVVPADSALSIPPQAIQAAFELSAAEARLVSALVAGRTTIEYARDSGHSRNTVRNQLASVLEKTGTRRQAELVTAIVSTIGMFEGARLDGGLRRR